MFSCAVCGARFLINIKAKAQRIVTYIVNVLILILGIAYTLYFRRLVYYNKYILCEFQRDEGLSEACWIRVRSKRVEHATNRSRRHRVVLKLSE